MARTINGTYTTGVTLTNPGDNPVLIAAGANLGNGSGIGLQSSQAVYWSVTNASGANISGGNFGVSLANAGFFTNSGSISASYGSGLGFSYNTATHGFSVLSAALFLGGGGVSNAAGGVISGGVDGVALGGSGNVFNAGTIRSTTPASTSVSGFGVVLAGGGTLTNASGGVVSSTSYGVFSDGSFSVTNQANARITGVSRGVFGINGAATLNNLGSIGGGQYGVRLSGGTITNQGTLSSSYMGALIAGAPGTVFNQGLIQNTTPETSQTFALGGVFLVAGGTLNNAVAGTISSTSYGALVYGAVGTVTNSGTIASSRTGGGAGVALITGGSVTNNAGGVITGEWIGVQSGPFGAATPSAAALVTVDNSGTISAADGKGDGAAVWVHGPGVVINRVGGVIEGSTNGTVSGGPLNGLFNGGFGVVAYYQTTLINYGSIGGASYAFDAAGTGASIGNRIEMAPGASFGGVVLGAHSASEASLSTLELLSGASVGTVTGFGTQYKNFGNIQVDNGARWNLGGTVANGTTISFASGGSGSLTLTSPTSMQGTVSGFAAGDTLTLTGVTVTGSAFANGVLTLNEASGTIALDIPGSFTTPVFDVTNGAAGASISVVGPALLDGLTVNQQLELIYIAYFNRAADSPGFTFWSGQNSQAQSGGQSASVALSNIANSFAPQNETVALYPFLAPLTSGGSIDLTTPTAQAGLNSFINSVYENLFGRAADQAGQAYWVGQITNGAVGLGAAALAIANGATGADAIEVWNKVQVALDFTTRTGTAGLGESNPLASSFVTAARSVLSGIDGTSLNDASVTVGMAATTQYIVSQSSGTMRAQSATQETSPIVISTPGATVDPGVGDNTIQFLAGSAGSTLGLAPGAVDTVSGFDPTADHLDFTALLQAANINLNGDIAALANYVTIVDQGANAVVNFDPSGKGGGGTVAVLQGLGATVTSLGSLITEGAVKIA